jgi:hypothetical protein
VQSTIKILALNAALSSLLVAAFHPGSPRKPYQERLGETLATQAGPAAVGVAAAKGDRLIAAADCSRQSLAGDCPVADTGSVRWITVAEPANGHGSVLRRVPQTNVALR